MDVGKSGVEDSGYFPCSFCYKTRCSAPAKLCESCQQIEPPVEKSYPEGLGEWRQDVYLPYLPTPLHKIEMDALVDWSRGQMIADIKEQTSHSSMKMRYGNRSNSVSPIMWPETFMKWSSTFNFKSMREGGEEMRTDIKQALTLAVVKRLRRYGIDETTYVLKGNRLPEHQSALYPAIRRCRAHRGTVEMDKKRLASKAELLCSKVCRHASCNNFKMLLEVYIKISKQSSRCMSCQRKPVMKCKCLHAYFCSSKCRALLGRRVHQCPMLFAARTD